MQGTVVNFGLSRSTFLPTNRMKLARELTASDKLVT